MNIFSLQSSCPDLFRASSRDERDRGAPVDGRDKPGHDVVVCLASLVFGSWKGR